jgi:hypothetical protein
VWESPSASLIEQDPEVIPDVDIAAQVGKDLFLDEKIPRHESGQGYVRVVEKSIMWRETETAKVFTYQGLTTCTELERVLFIGTQFSILYTSMYSPAEAATPRA